MERILEILKELEESIYSEQMVKELIKKDKDDYFKGEVSGKIQIINSIRIILDEDN